MDWREPEIPAKYRKLYEQGRAGKAKAAIRCHCLMCVGWEPNEVEKCTATGCPLYTLRNLGAQSQTEAVDRAKRRQRAIASGRRPPKHAAADRRGAHDEGPISNAGEQPATPTPPDSSLRPEGAFTTDASDA